MPRHPQEPHLIGIRIDGNVVAVIRAMSLPEGRDHFLAEHVEVERLSSSEAFRIGQRLEFDIENAKPEYADAEPTPQLDLLPDAAGSEVSHG